jgi:hypothetical protein
MLLSPLASAEALGDLAGRQATGTLGGRYLPANTWVRLDPIATERFVPKHFTDCTQRGVLSNPIGRRASGVTLGGDDIFYFGGGGQSHPGNDVEIFEIASNQWRQQYQPECLPPCCIIDRECDPACVISAGVGTTEITPLGRPYVEKPFQLVAYNPLRRRFAAALTSGTWEWDPSTGEWSLLTADRPESRDIATKMLVYDPDLGTLLYFATSGPNALNHSVFQFDYSDYSWVPHSDIPIEISSAEIYAAFDSKAHEYLVSHGSGTMWIYDGLDGTWTQLQDVPTEAMQAKSLAYDPIHAVFVVEKRRAVDNSALLWMYDSASDTWTRLHPAGTSPVVTKEEANHLVFDDVWKRFYFVNVRGVGGGGQGGGSEGNVETWAYRIDGPLGPGDGNCDGHLTAADLVSLVAAVGATDPSACGAVDVDRDGSVSGVDLVSTAKGIFVAEP